METPTRSGPVQMEANPEVQAVLTRQRNLAGELRDLDTRIRDHQISLAAMATGEDITDLLELLTRPGSQGSQGNTGGGTRANLGRLTSFAILKGMAAHLVRALQPDTTSQRVETLAIRLARHKSRLDLQVNHAVWDHVAAVQLGRDVSWLLLDAHALQARQPGGHSISVLDNAIAGITALQQVSSATSLNALVARTASRSMRTAVSDLVTNTIPAWLEMANHHDGLAREGQVARAAAVLADKDALPTDRVAAARVLGGKMGGGCDGAGTDGALQAGLQVLQGLRNTALADQPGLVQLRDKGVDMAAGQPADELSGPVPGGPGPR